MFSGEKQRGEQLGFVRIVIAATMGCFFGCFRIRDSQSHLISTSKRVASRDDKHALSSLFSSDDDLLGSGGEARDRLPEEVDARELKNEAKFLKACGTLPETPLEIRKASGNWLDASAKKDESLKFKSWLPCASIEKLKLEKEPTESPSPVKYCEEWLTEAGSVDTPISCMTDGHNTRRNSISPIQSSDIQNVVTRTDVPDNETHSSPVSSVSPGIFTTTVRGKTKSVRFECQSDNSAFSSETSSQRTKRSGSAGNSSESRPSPYPTPLKLSDEMQTPGTVFPSYLNNMADGKANRIRSQYVYSALNPIEHPSMWKDLKEENSLKQNDDSTLKTSPISSTSIKELSVGKDGVDEEGFSWFKPNSDEHDGNNEQFGTDFSGENIHFGRTPGDRPILGIVAAHWNDEESSHISPKWWDGNGIPNSTNKYKEDQKVSWHATPFEERLEKALSQETIIPHRKPIIGTPPVEYDETEESDAGSPQLQSSAHLDKPIVSC